MKHTKGEWKLINSPIAYYPNRFLISANTKEKVLGKDAIIGTLLLKDHFSCDYTLDENGQNGYNIQSLPFEANAKLIAAAPELLSELIDCLYMLEGLHVQESALESIKQAIKKATQ